MAPKNSVAHQAVVINKNEVRMRDLHSCLRRLYNSRGLSKNGSKGTPLAAMLWGPPGVAKSALAQQFATDVLKMPFVDIRLPLYDPVDLKGMPSVSKITVNILRGDKRETREVDATTFIAPQFLPYEPYVMLFEEIANAHESTMVTAQRIILDRNLDNGWAAHEDTMMICASNRQSDACGANALLQALDNRLVHYEITPDIDFWLDWLIETYGSDQYGQKAAAQVAAFITFRKDLAYQFDPESTFKDLHGWPSFRSWEMVTRILMDTFKCKEKIKNVATSTSIMGSIGVGAGFDFLAFIELQDKLPDINEIMDGKKFTIPQGKPDLLAALVGAVASHCEPKYHNRIWQIVKEIEDAGSPDWGILLVRMCVKFDPHIGWVNGDKKSNQYTKGARDFCMRHKSEAITIFKQKSV